MKAIIFIICMCIVSASFATETETTCIRSMDSNDRGNPKQNLQTKVKTTQKPSTSKQ